MHNYDKSVNNHALDDNFPKVVSLISVQTEIVFMMRDHSHILFVKTIFKCPNCLEQVLLIDLHPMPVILAN